MDSFPNKHSQIHYASFFRHRRLGLFQALRAWLNAIEFTTPEAAHLVCRLIPAQCPFARKVSLLGCILFSIPPLCKLNPLYNELVALRFRALTFLAETGEDITPYCE
ncbi:Mo-dependent nitrogenase [Synechococcus moorigangaii CMS01]|nr:Mo-dependent nitrogenase [Synechococcus moorigangaii CMS01]